MQFSLRGVFFCHQYVLHPAWFGQFGSMCSPQVQRSVYLYLHDFFEETAVPMYADHVMTKLTFLHPVTAVPDDKSLARLKPKYSKVPLTMLTLEDSDESCFYNQVNIAFGLPHLPHTPSLPLSISFHSLSLSLSHIQSSLILTTTISTYKSTLFGVCPF